jgi:hypothetical protein
MKYENQLKRALEKFASACDEMAQLPLTHDLADEHITYVQKITSDRVRDLKKQLEAKPAKTSIELPQLGEKKATEKKADSKPAESKVGSDFGDKNKSHSSSPSFEPGA